MSARPATRFVTAAELTVGMRLMDAGYPTSTRIVGLRFEITSVVIDLEEGRSDVRRNYARLEIAA